MRRPIGDQNATRLLTVWTGNAIIFAWAFLDFEPTVDKWQSLLIVPLIVAATAILNGVIDPFRPRHFQNPYLNSLLLTAEARGTRSDPKSATGVETEAERVRGPPGFAVTAKAAN